MEMSNTYIIGIDQSTAGTKVLLVNEKGEIVYKKQKAHHQFYPHPGWVEHDPVEIMENVWELLKDATDQVTPEDKIISIAITNQRETVLIWDSVTGVPIHNAIVWQCRRTSDYCQQIIELGKEEIVQEKTGLRVDPYFSATKLNWILNNVDGAKDQLNKNQLMAGTIDSWLIWNLTNRGSYKTDITNASRTLIYNIYDLQWDPDLIQLFNLENLQLPEVCSCNAYFGETDLLGMLPYFVPITGVIGDSQGALFAQRCNKKGTAKATFGTGTSIMMNIGEKPIASHKGLVTAIAWALDHQIQYALEGIIHCSGDTINWLKNDIGLFDSFDEIEALAKSVPSNEGVYLVPALVGYGIPYWNPNAKAAIVGMTRATTKAHLVRAGLESIVYQIYDAIQIMEEVSQVPLESLRVDGGGTTNQFLIQFQADILSKEVITSEIKELSVMGAVYIAGLKVGLWKTLEGLNENAYRSTQPQMEAVTREKNIKLWKEAVELIVN